MGVWQANGCMTAARHRALDAHLNQLRGPANGQEATPGCTAHTPSRRTLQRWHAERRRLSRPP